MHRNDEAAVGFPRDFGCERAIKGGVDHRARIDSQKRNRDQAARTKPEVAAQAFGAKVNLAVAAKAGCAHGHCFNHGAIAADQCACGVDLGQTAAQNGDVGGGAANVADKGVGSTGKPARADDAGGRAGQNGFDRPLTHHRGGNQRPVAAHHHQRCGDADPGQMPLAGGDQAVQHTDQAGVQDGGQGAFRAIQTGGKFMRAGDRASGKTAHQIARGNLVRRVAGGEPGGDGKAHDFGAKRGNGGFQSGQIQGGEFAAGVGMAADKLHHGIAAKGCGQTGAIKVCRFKPDEQKCHAPALAFDQRVGRKRGGQRDECDLRRRDACGGKCCIDGTTNAKRQIGAGGQRFGLADDAVGVGVQDHRVGVGAAGIHAQKIRHRPHAPVFAVA